MSTDQTTADDRPALTRTKTDDPTPSYRLDGASGTLTYEPAMMALSADGDLPPWSVAHAYAVGCRDALGDGGENALWAYLEAHYRRMAPAAPGEAVSGRG